MAIPWMEDGASGVRVKMWPLDTPRKEEAVNAAAAADVMTRENATRRTCEVKLGRKGIYTGVQVDFMSLLESKYKLERGS